MALGISLAETVEDRKKVFEFRYQIYVEEMCRTQKHADHMNRTIIEPLDKDGFIIAAFENDTVVGTVRTNFGRYSNLGHYPKLYDMECAGELFPERVSITTKLMVAREYRSGTLGIRLAKAAYRLACEAGVLLDFIDCNRHLESLFEGLGYRRFRDKITHSEYGEVLPLVLILHDSHHLATVRSPFLKVWQAYIENIAPTDISCDAPSQVYAAIMNSGGSQCEEVCEADSAGSLDAAVSHAKRSKQRTEPRYRGIPSSY